MSLSFSDRWCTENKCLGVVTISNCFLGDIPPSMFSILRPLKSKEMVGRYHPCVPSNLDIIRCDRGKVFDNVIFRALKQAVSTTFVPSHCPGNPNVSGSVERPNREVKRALYTMMKLLGTSYWHVILRRRYIFSLATPSCNLARYHQRQKRPELHRTTSST